MPTCFGCFVNGDERVASREQPEQEEQHPMVAMSRFAGQIAHLVVDVVDVAQDSRAREGRYRAATN